MQREDTHTITRRSFAGLRCLSCLLGALLLASCSGSTGVTIPTDPAAELAPTATPTPTTAPTPAGVGAFDDDQEFHQVIIAVATIPLGTSVAELVEAPTVYLSERAIPLDFVSTGAIGTMAELRDFDAMFLAADILPGEQLLRSHFQGPASFDGPAYEVPPGHDVEVLLLPAGRVLGGLVVYGDTVRVISTEVGPNSEATSTVLLEEVEVLAVHSSLGADPPQDAFDGGGRDRDGYNITIALEPDQAARLATALERSATIRVTRESTIAGEYATLIELPQSRALEGEVRRGDVVNVVVRTGTDDPSYQSSIIASDVGVLGVNYRLIPLGSEARTDVGIMLSVTEDELLNVATAAESSELALERPQ